MVGIGSIIEIAGRLIEKLIPDPQAKATAQLELLRLTQSGELKELETRMSAIVAEARSSDKWTSRARPSFMYVFYAILLTYAIVFPIVGIFAFDAMTAFYANAAAGLNAIPDGLWSTFTIGFTGYAVSRTVEKVAKHKNGGK